MNQVYSTAIVLFLVAISSPVAIAQNDPVAVVSEEELIRQSIDSYVTAFNVGDAKSLANHWSEAGVYITPAGETLQGREAIEVDFAKYFSETKGAMLELVETNITFLSPSVAVESGLARVIAADQEPGETKYEAVHVKTSAGWQIDRISEQERPASPPSHYEQLKSLEWIVGNWVDSDQDSSVETTCHWTTNKNFLVRSFKVYIADSVDFEGTQVIGWDVRRSTIRSWLFDSDGGFGVGYWSRDENRWVARTLSVLPDGRVGSAINIYDKLDERTLQFRSIGRQVDGELLPNVEPITVTRVSEQ